MRDFTTALFDEQNRVIVGDPAGDTTTTETIAIGETVSSTIDSLDDADWYAIGLTAGQTIDVSLIGGSLFDPYVYVYDSNGNLVAADDDISWPTNPDSLLQFTATTAGVYYIAADRYDWNDETGEYYPNLGSYSLTVTEVQPYVDSPTTNPLLHTIDWGTQVGTRYIDVYFAPAGFSADGYTSEGFNAYELQQFAAIFDMIETLTNLTINIASDSTQAEFVVLLDTNEVNGDFLGYFNPPGEPNQGVGVFDGNGWDRTAGGNLEQGGDGWYTIVHEFMHGLGLAHPHDTGGTSTIMDGVTSAFDDYGTYDLNQGVFTIMSYNPGWYTGSAGTQPPAALTYGEVWGPMALDIAALQENYGANGNTNGGDNIYTLPTTNASGTFFTCIWDTGGRDAIEASGTLAATIDLRAATLVQEVGGGGWVSFADGIAGGFTIAHGVAIENATGADGNDTITGNDMPNVLIGNAGNDSIIGGDGIDRILGGEGDDILDGGAGRDRIIGDTGNDSIMGGDRQDTLLGSNGNDTLDGNDGDDVLRGNGDHDLESGGLGNDIVIGGTGRDTLFGDEGNDTLRGNGGFDTVTGGDGDDYVAGGSQADLVLGASGNDTLSGGGGYDTLNGGTGNDELTGNFNADRFVFVDGHGDDTITDFEATNNAERIDLRYITALTSLADLDLGSASSGAATQVGGDVVIDTGGGNSITLTGVSLSDLDASDFMF